MKNTKNKCAKMRGLLAIISLAAVIVFSIAACKNDGDTSTGSITGLRPGNSLTQSSGNNNGGGGSFDSALVGTWAGDSTNGTLTVTKDAGFSGTPPFSKADDIASEISGNQLVVAGAGFQGLKASLTINGGEVIMKMSANGFSEDQLIYKYKIDGNTLTFTDGESGEEEFKGTKQ